MAEYKGRKRGPKAFEFTEEVYQKIEELAGQGLNERDIAYCIGMHPTTFSEKKYKLEKLRESVKKGQAQGLQTVTSCLMDQVKSGNPTSTIFYLKNRSPNEWNDVQSINSVQINLGKMTDSQLLNELRSDQGMVEALKNVIPQLADKQLIENID